MNIHSVIQDAIKKCNLVFFVGAGFSKPLGLPNWTELVKVITDDLKRDYPNDAFIVNIVDMIRQKYYTEIEALDKLKSKHLARILTVLNTTTGIDLSKKDLSRHEKIWQITDQVVTTNYDKAFDIVAPGKSPKVVYEDDFHVSRLSGMDSFLFKVHGSIEHPAKCVLFSDQYKKLYDGRTGAALELFQILSGKTIIFLGFSLNDPFVNELLTLRREAYQGLKQNNFIITTDDKDFSEYGVERIEAVKNYEADLDEFLDELVRIRDNYPYGLGMLIRGLTRQGKEFNIEDVRKGYFDFLFLMEKKPQTESVVEEVKAGEFENAEEKLKAELEEQLKVNKESGENAAEKAFELATLKLVQLKYRESLKYCQMAIELQSENELYLNQLGIILSELGQNEESIKYYEKSLTIAVKIYGKGHSEIATRYNNIGLSWTGLGEYRKALTYHKKALAINKVAQGETHHDTATDYNNIGGVWRNLGYPKKAIEFYRKALAIDLTLHGEEDSSVANRYNNIGGALNDMGEPKKALEYYEKALAISQIVFDEGHPEIATLLNNIGGAWKRMGEPKKAIEYYERALFIDQELYGEKHHKVAIRYNNLASAWNDLGEQTKALKYNERALAITLEVYGDKHPIVARRYNNMGSTLVRQKEYAAAIGFFEKALTIARKTLGEAHPLTKTIYKNLGIAQKANSKNKP